MAIDWKGVFPAVTTKFTASDELDLDLFKLNIQAQLDAGVHGIILGGTLGESSVLSTQEKEVLVKTAVAHVNGKVPVIINIAEGSTSGCLRRGEGSAAETQEQDRVEVTRKPLH